MQTNKLKKGLHSKLVLFFAQNQVRTKKNRSSLKIRPKKKGLHPKLVPFFCQYQGRKEDKGKKINPKLNATSLTLPGPPRPGPRYDVPPESPSCRPWVPCTSRLTKPSACRDYELETQHKNCEQNEKEAQDSHKTPLLKLFGLGLCLICCLLNLYIFFNREPTSFVFTTYHLQLVK